LSTSSTEQIRCAISSPHSASRRRANVPGGAHRREVPAEVVVPTGVCRADDTLEWQFSPIGGKLRPVGEGQQHCLGIEP